MLTKKAAKNYTRSLDKLANQIQANHRAFGLSKKAAYDFCMKVDQISDRIEKFPGRRAEVLHRDDDEDYLNYFDIGGVVHGVGDEDERRYMDNFDDDVERSLEYPVEGETKWKLKNHPQSGFDVDASWLYASDEDEEEEDEEKEASWLYASDEDEEEEDEEKEASWLYTADEDEEDEDEDEDESKEAYLARRRASRRPSRSQRTASSHARRTRTSRRRASRPGRRR